MAMTSEQRQIILQELEQGGSLRTAAKLAGIGSASTIKRWVASDNHFAAQYTRAREQGLDELADQVIAIADDQTIDANARRVMMDARRWYLSKLAPKRYGERTEHSLTITHNVEQLSTAELELLVHQQRTLELLPDGTVGGGREESDEAG